MLITYEEFIEWYKREKSAFKPDGRKKESKPRQRMNIRRVGLLIGCQERAAHRYVHDSDAFEGSNGQIVLDLVLRVPGALDHRMEQVKSTW